MLQAPPRSALKRQAEDAPAGAGATQLSIRQFLSPMGGTGSTPPAPRAKAARSTAAATAPQQCTAAASSRWDPKSGHLGPEACSCSGHQQGHAAEGVQRACGGKAACGGPGVQRDKLPRRGVATGSAGVCDKENLGNNT